jgi:hypothetical protein
MATKEELIQRALNTGNMLSSFVHEDLSDLITQITPRDVALFPRLKTLRATQSLHEWRERSLTAPGSSAYDGETALPGASTNTGTARDNKVMQVGRTASVTNFLNAMNTVGKANIGDAWAIEMEEKMANVIRDIEYYLWRGDRTVTSPQESDGIVTMSSNFVQVANAGSAAALVETKLHEAIYQLYDNGSYPDTIYCRPVVAQRIANFTADKVRYMGAPNEAGGTKPGTLQYLSPFGAQLNVVPVRQAFIPSGSIYVMDSSKMGMAWLSQGIEVMDVPITLDEVGRKLIKAYFTLEVRGYTHHAKITNVADSL